MLQPRVVSCLGLTLFALAGCAGDEPAALVAQGPWPATPAGSCEASCTPTPYGQCAIADPAPVEPVAVRSTLAQNKSCAELTATVRERALRQMNAALDYNLQQALAIACQPCLPPPPFQDGGVIMMDAGVMADGGLGGGGEAATDFSTTNTQVADVDEPDFLKNDGGYIYVVAGGKLRIIDAWPPETAQTVAAVPVRGTPTGLFVHADRAVVYSTLGTAQPVSCAWAYTCQFEGQPGPTIITVFDIVDRSHPVKLREIELGGGLLSSRRMGNLVRTVMLGDDINLPWYEAWPAEVPRSIPYCAAQWGPVRPSAAAVKAAFDALRSRNRALIEQATTDLVVPKLVDERTGPAGPVTEQPLAAGDCRGFHVADSGDGARLLSLVSFDLLAADPLAVTTVVGRAGAVYATRESLYLAAPYFDQRWSMTGWGYVGGGEQTVVHKFRLDAAGPAASYAASGLVGGHVLNQFALDERLGDLRIATSQSWSPARQSAVRVLRQAGGALQVVGELDGIAPMEDLKAVRFDGARAYVVTFRQTDPLFVIDLSDPTAPAMQGELVIPGFSTYLHPMDATHLIGIGFEGNGAWFSGLQLQVFDVTDPFAPRLLHKEVIGTHGASSDATANHMAFNYFAPKDLLAIPMVICEASTSGGYYGASLTFDGLLVYRVTVGEGFTRLGGLPHLDPAVADAGGNGCYSWWTSPNSGVKRSIIMDDYVFAVALDNIRAAPLSDLAHPVATIDLTN